MTVEEVTDTVDTVDTTETDSSEKQVEFTFNLKPPKELMKPRFVKGFNTTKDEVKRICEENGVIWGVD